MVTYGMALALSKPIAERYGTAQMAFLRGITIVVALTAAALPHITSSLQWHQALLALALGIAGYLPVLAFTHGLRRSPVGIMAPIAGTSSLVTILLAFIFLQVSLQPLQWLAIALVIGANIALSVDVKNWRQSRLLHAASGIPYAALAALGWGLFLFLLVPLSKSLGPWLAALLVELGVTLAAGLHIALRKQSVLFADALRPAVVVNGLLLAAGTVAYTVGVTYFNIPIVAALSNATALVATICGIVLFHEKLHAKERIASVVMIAGIAALPLFS